MNLPTVDLDHIDAGFKAALQAINRGGQLEDGIAIPPFGQSSTVGKMLTLASQHLDEAVNDDDRGLVEAVKKRIGLKEANVKKIIASALIRKLKG